MCISRGLFRLFLGFYLIFALNLQSHFVEPITLVKEITLIDDFYKALTAQKPTAIKLYSKNCPHCKIFEKPFEESAKKCKNIDFFTIDGKRLNAPQIISEITNNQIKIPGYPTILYIKNGAITD